MLWDVTESFAGPNEDSAVSMGAICFRVVPTS